MTSEHRRRSNEASILEISDKYKEIIEKVDQNPERTFRQLENKGYRIPGRPHSGDRDD